MEIKFQKRATENKLSPNAASKWQQYNSKDGNTSFSEKYFWKDLEWSIKSFSRAKIFLAIESLVARVAS